MAILRPFDIRQFNCNHFTSYESTTIFPVFHEKALFTCLHEFTSSSSIEQQLVSSPLASPLHLKKPFLLFLSSYLAQTTINSSP